MTTQTKYRKYDSESDYYAMGYRMYSAEFGRFLAVDPLFEAMPRHSPYHYSYNSPMFWSDPSGLFPLSLNDLKFFGDALLEMVDKELAYIKSLPRYDAGVETQRPEETFQSREGGGGGNNGSFIGNIVSSVVNFFSNLFGGGDDEGDQTSIHDFLWNGKTVYVKYNTKKVTKDVIEKRFTKALDDVTRGDDEGVLATIPDFYFDISYGAFTLGKLWSAECLKKTDILAGIASNIWSPELILDEEDSKSACNLSWTTPGWIYLAEGYFTNESKEMTALKDGYGQFNYVESANLDQFIFVLAHELKHRYDSITQISTKVPYAPFKREPSADKFMFKIVNFYFPNR